MKEKTLLKIALICSVVGIAMLYIFSEGIEIDESTIENINKGNVGESIKIKGVLSRVSSADNAVFLEITQPQTLSVILFKEKDINITLEEGDYVEIIGKIEEYKGKREVIADRVRVIS